MARGTGRPPLVYLTLNKLSYLILSYLILSYLILSYAILSYLICVHRTLNRAQTRAEHLSALLKLYATSDQKIALKWPLDLSFTAYYKVRTFQNVFLCAYFNLTWVKTCARTNIYV